MTNNPDRELIGAVLPGYEVGVELGRGAWGVVLSGRHKRLDRQVAIKQLPRAFAADAQVAARFLREAQMAASLDHPHIVPVYDYVEENGLALIVMEQCPTTVGNKFTTEGMHTDEACAAALATCSALAYAHSRGVLHRDIKPENLLIDAEGVVKLGDFGIARAIDSATRLTATGMVIGTPAYMSPEQAGGQDLDATSDVYTTGVVLYELLSGELPFAGVESLAALIRQHLFEPPRPLASVSDGIAPRIAEVVDRSLAKDPAQRWESASAFGVALGEATSHVFGAGWLRQRRFALLGAPEIIAATEREVGGDGRAGAIHVGGDSTVPDPRATVVPTGDLAPPTAPGPAGSPAVRPASAGASPGVPVVPAASAGSPPGATVVPPTSATSATEQPAAPSLPIRPQAFAPPRPSSADATVSAPSSGGAWPPSGPVVDDAPGTVPGQSGGGSKRTFAILAAVGAVLLAAIAVLAFTVFRSSDEPLATDDTIEPDASSTTGPPATEASPTVGDDPVAAPVGAGPLVIGSLVDNGEFARDEDQLVAMDLAVEDIEAAGGVLGESMVFLPGTYDGDPELVAVAIDHLTQGATAIVGPSSPVDTNDVLATVTEQSAILMSPTDFFSRPDESGLYFQTRIPNTLVAEAAVSLLAADTSVAAVVVPSDSFLADEDVLAVLSAALEARGIQEVRVEVVDDNVAAAASAVAAAGPDVIMIFAITSKTEIYQALIAAGVGPANVEYLAINDDGGALEMGDGQITGARGVTVDFLTGQTLEERLPAADLSSSATQAYDAVILLALAAELAASPAATVIATALPEVTSGGETCMTFADCKALLADGADIDYLGPGGPYSISPETGRPRAGFFRVSTITDSGFVGTRDQLVFESPR